MVAFHAAARSPTVACVVNVTRAFARGGLLELRLRADFVVTEAMVVFTGRQPVLLLLAQGGRAALAGQRSRGAVWSLVNNDRSRGGPEAFGVATALPRRVCQLASVLHAASCKV